MKERDLLKKSGLYTIVALIIVSIVWFLFSIQTSFGYSPDGASSDIKNGSRVNIGTGTDGLYIQPGSGTTANDAEVRIYFGTQSCRGSGTVGYILPGTLTGLPFLNYLYNNGSSTIDFNGFDQVTIDGSSVGTSGSFIVASNGVGTNTILYNPTIAGVGTITASFGANGLVITPAEYASTDNATGELQAQIDTRLIKVGTIATYLGSVEAGGKTGTSTLKVYGGSNVIVTATSTASGELSVTFDTTGSVTAKADIQEGGTNTVTNASFQNYNNNDFDTAVNGLGADIALSAQRKGTTTPTVGYAAIGDANNSLGSWIPTWNATHTVKTDTFSTNSSTWIDVTGLSVAITPTTASKNILVFYSVSGGATNMYSYMRLLRGSTPIYIGDAASARTQSSGAGFDVSNGADGRTISGMLIDSPGTTSATTYKVQVFVKDAAGTMYINQSGNTDDAAYIFRSASSIVLLEVN